MKHFFFPSVIFLGVNHGETSSDDPPGWDLGTLFSDGFSVKNLQIILDMLTYLNISKCEMGFHHPFLMGLRLQQPFCWNPTFGVFFWIAESHLFTTACGCEILHQAG